MKNIGVLDHAGCHHPDDPPQMTITPFRDTLRHPTALKEQLDKIRMQINTAGRALRLPADKKIIRDFFFTFMANVHKNTMYY